MVPPASRRSSGRRRIQRGCLCHVQSPGRARGWGHAGGELSQNERDRSWLSPDSEQETRQHEYLRRARHEIEARPHPPGSKQILGPIAAHEVIDFLRFEHRLHHGELSRITGAEDGNQFDLGIGWRRGDRRRQRDAAQRAGEARIRDVLAACRAHHAVMIARPRPTRPSPASHVARCRCHRTTTNGPARRSWAPRHCYRNTEAAPAASRPSMPIVLITGAPGFGTHP
jgi:hypothetical protein